MKCLFTGLLYLVLSAHPLFAAAISIKSALGLHDSPDKKAIWIEGEIRPGDFTRMYQASVKILSSDATDLLIYLDSPGGEVNEAMKMGLLARELLATTLVVGNVFYDPNSREGKQHLADLQMPDADVLRQAFGYFQARPKNLSTPLPVVKCYSACVLVFWGGVKKDVSDNHWLEQAALGTPVIGLHRAFYDPAYFKALDPNQAFLQFEQLKDAVTVYLRRMGAPNDLVHRMYRTESTGLELIPAAQFKSWFASEEPYYQEWLQAKCGSEIPDFIRNDAESKKLFDEVVHLKSEEGKGRAAQQGARSIDEEMLDAMLNYMPPGYSEVRYKNWLALSRYYNKKYQDCAGATPETYRADWVKQEKALNPAAR